MIFSDISKLRWWKIISKKYFLTQKISDISKIYRIFFSYFLIYSGKWYIKPGNDISIYINFSDILMKNHDISIKFLWYIEKRYNDLYQNTKKSWYIAKIRFFNDIFWYIGDISRYIARYIFYFCDISRVFSVIYRKNIKYIEWYILIYRDI